MPRSYAPLLLAVALATAGLCSAPLVAGAAAQDQMLTLDIRAQSLSGALVEFSRRSGLVVVAPADLVAGKQAPAIRGAFTADDALARILAHSGLEARRRPSGGLTLVASTATPGRVQQDQSAIGDHTIIVTGQPLLAMTRAYADAIVGDTRRDETAPRWSAGICPSVAGLAPDQARALIDHVALRARQVGLNTERAGCEPNLVVIFAADSDVVARRVVETRRDLLGYLTSDGVITAGRDALESFAATPRAVRWWHVARLVNGQGQPVATERVRRGGGTRADGQEFSAEDSLGGFAEIGAVRTRATRTRRETYADLSFVLIIVDSRRIAGVPQRAIADYLSVAALAQIDPRADMSGFHSILNLFGEEAADRAAREMTAWDLAYLQSLYGVRPGATSARRHNAELARLMAERISRD